MTMLFSFLRKCPLSQHPFARPTFCCSGFVKEAWVQEYPRAKNTNWNYAPPPNPFPASKGEDEVGVGKNFGPPADRVCVPHPCFFIHCHQFGCEFKDIQTNLLNRIKKLQCYRILNSQISVKLICYNKNTLITGMKFWLTWVWQ